MKQNKKIDLIEQMLWGPNGKQKQAPKESGMLNEIDQMLYGGKPQQANLEVETYDEPEENEEEY